MSRIVKSHFNPFLKPTSTKHRGCKVSCSRKQREPLMCSNPWLTDYESDALPTAPRRPSVQWIKGENSLSLLQIITERQAKYSINFIHLQIAVSEYRIQFTNTCKPKQSIWIALLLVIVVCESTTSRTCTFLLIQTS